MLYLIEEREKVDSLLADYRSVRSICSEKRQELTETEDMMTYLDEAFKITQHVAEQIQQRVHTQIASVVSRCLESVFYDKEYGLKIDFVRSKNRTSAVLMLTLDGHEIVNPLNSDSGAVCEIAGFALRMACLVMSKPKLRRLMVLDEPFKALSAEYFDTARKMIQGLSEDFNVQIIQVTHNPKLQTGKVIEL